MKKKLFLAALLTVLLTALLVAFSGCQSEPKPLRVCVDLEHRGGIVGHSPENAIYNFMNSVKSLGGPEDVEFESAKRRYRA